MIQLLCVYRLDIVTKIVMRLYADGISSLVSNYIFLMVVIRLDRENSTRATQIQPKAIICGVPKLSPK